MSRRPIAPALSRARRARHACREDVSLNLPRGATLGMVGESGSGKSTLARCIVRLIDPDAGTIVLEGRTGPAVARERPPRDASHPDGVSGSFRFAQSAPQGRPNRRRKARSCTARRARRRCAMPRSCSRWSASIRRGRPLSARILRRSAPAHRHRPRAGAEAGRAGRRRAGLGARCLGAGAGAQAARRTARAARPLHRLHHARSARCRANLRPRRCHEGR